MNAQKWKEKKFKGNAYYISNLSQRISSKYLKHHFWNIFLNQMDKFQVARNLSYTDIIPGTRKGMKLAGHPESVSGPTLK